jgi:hypothetical protein
MRHFPSFMVEYRTVFFGNLSLQLTAPMMRDILMAHWPHGLSRLQKRSRDTFALALFSSGSAAARAVDHWTVNVQKLQIDKWVPVVRLSKDVDVVTSVDIVHVAHSPITQ